MSNISSTHRAIRFYPPSFDVRVEEIESPKIQHADDAIVKVSLAALCGSDLHIYRGHAKVTQIHTCGHEFLGEIVELGTSYSESAMDRPHGYSTLKVGDKVVSPFTVNCGECHVCRLGYTCRCPEGALFGSPVLEGGQAQYVRVPKAGGTLFNLDDPTSWITSLSHEERVAALKSIADSSLLLLADILPTGVFAAIQALNHPKVLSMIFGRPWPLSLLPASVGDTDGVIALQESDKVLTFAIVGLGPVGVCASVSLLDMLSSKGLPFRIVAIDPIESRREKMKTVYDKIPADGKASGEFVVKAIDDAKEVVKEWTNGVGCSAVLEIVGNNNAISLAYELVRPFGAIISVGVHGLPQMPFTGKQLYDKNVSFDFGRCPARSMFPMAFDLLVKRQDVFGGVGEPASLVDRIVDFSQTDEMYRAFEKGDVGKIVFDPWK